MEDVKQDDLPKRQTLRRRKSIPTLKIGDEVLAEYEGKWYGATILSDFFGMDHVRNKEQFYKDNYGGWVQVEVQWHDNEAYW